MADRPSRAEAIATELRDAILRGSYAAGDRLPAERELAERLGSSRSSVREALGKLEQLGLVEIRHGGGATVRPIEDASLDLLRHMLVRDGVPDLELVGQLLDVHELLMTAAVRLAVQSASEAELERARVLLEGLADPGIGDVEYLASVEELVQLISVASRNLVLRLVRNGLRAIFVEQAGRRRERLRPPRSVITPLARGIARALETRDAATAERGVRRLLRANREQFMKRLEARYAAVPESPPTKSNEGA